MQNIKLVIFDLDGTLIDAYAAIVSSLNYTLRELGYSPQGPGVIRRAVGRGDASLLRPFVRREDLKRGVFFYRRHHRGSLVEKSRLFPGVKSLLNYLKLKGYKLAVASNRPTEFSRILLRHLGLNKYFNYSLCADKLKRGKPDPEILKRIMRKFFIEPKQALYVGDMVIDARAGRRARVKTVIVTTGSSSREEVKKERPFRTIKSISALFKIL